MTTAPITEIPAGYLADAKGRLVPQNLVKPAELLEDQTVRNIIEFADALSQQIGRFKGHCFDDVSNFMALLSEQYGGSKGGAKGNVTLSSFDGALKVEVRIADRITFGPELQVAKELIDECIETWAAGSRDEIRTLIDSAFQADQSGGLNREAVLRLRRLNIQDETWQIAMQALTDSIRVEGSKTHMRFYRRSSPQEKYQMITIDLASA